MQNLLKPLSFLVWLFIQFTTAVAIASNEARVTPVTFGGEAKHPIECRISGLALVASSEDDTRLYTFEPEIGIDNPAQPFGFDLKDFASGEYILKFAFKISVTENRNDGATSYSLIDTKYYLKNEDGSLVLIKRETHYEGSQSDIYNLLKAKEIKSLPKTVRRKSTNYLTVSAISAKEIQLAQNPMTHIGTHDMTVGVPLIVNDKEMLETQSINEPNVGLLPSASLACEARRTVYYY